MYCQNQVCSRLVWKLYEQWEKKIRHRKNWNRPSWIVHHDEEKPNHQPAQRIEWQSNRRPQYSKPGVSKQSLESVERLEGQNQIWNKPQTDLNDQRLRGVLLEVVKRIFGREKCLWGIVYDWVW